MKISWVPCGLWDFSSYLGRAGLIPLLQFTPGEWEWVLQLGRNLAKLSTFLPQAQHRDLGFYCDYCSFHTLFHFPLFLCYSQLRCFFGDFSFPTFMSSPLFSWHSFLISDAISQLHDLLCFSRMSFFVRIAVLGDFALVDGFSHALCENRHP